MKLLSLNTNEVTVLKGTFSCNGKLDGIKVHSRKVLVASRWKSSKPVAYFLSKSLVNSLDVLNSLIVLSVALLKEETNS